jgi:hypothetical protein
LTTTHTPSDLVFVRVGWRHLSHGRFFLVAVDNVC